MKAWLKGGLIGGVLAIPALFSVWSLYLFFPVIWILNLINPYDAVGGTNVLSTVIMLYLGIFIEGFIIGAIIGLIVGKIKNR